MYKNREFPLEVDVKKINKKIKRDFKNKYNQKITTQEINKIWHDYVKMGVLEDLSNGGIVNLFNDMKIWVKAIPIHENKRAMALLNKGLMYVGGRIVEAKLNHYESRFIYKITADINRDKDLCNNIYFAPHRNLKLAFKDGLKRGKIITRTTCQ